MQIVAVLPTGQKCVLDPGAKIVLHIYEGEASVTNQPVARRTIEVCANTGRGSHASASGSSGSIGMSSDGISVRIDVKA